MPLHFSSRIAGLTLLVVGFILAGSAKQSPADDLPPPGRQVPVGPTTLDSEALRRTAAWLRTIEAGKVDPKLLDQVRELLKKNPDLAGDPKQLAEKFRQQNPGLTPADLERYRALAKQLGGNLGTDGKGGTERKVGAGGSANPPLGPQPQQAGTSPATVEANQPPNTSATPPTPFPPPLLPPPRLPNTPRSPNSPPPNIPPIPVTGGQPPGEGHTAIQIGAAGIFDPVNQARAQKRAEQRAERANAVAGWWEQNVGPLNETPAVRDVLFEMFTGRNGDSNASALDQLLDPSGAGGPKLDGLPEVGSGWKFPEFGLGGGPSQISGPSVSSAGSMGSIGGMGGDSWLPVILLGLLLGGGLIAWYIWPKLLGGSANVPRPVPGLGPWPVDPRTVADRVALVAAFEYLSVLVCGTGARVWNHETIAAALQTAVPGQEDLAVPLAQLYALARYTPFDEPLPTATYPEARRCLCRLAGVAAP